VKASKLMELAMEIEKEEDTIKNKILSIPVNRRNSIGVLREKLGVVRAKRRKAWREYEAAIQTNLNI